MLWPNRKAKGTNVTENEIAHEYKRTNLVQCILSDWPSTDICGNNSSSKNENTRISYCVKCELTICSYSVVHSAIFMLVPHVDFCLKNWNLWNIVEEGFVGTFVIYRYSISCTGRDICLCRSPIPAVRIWSLGYVLRSIIIPWTLNVGLGSAKKSFRSLILLTE